MTLNAFLAICATLLGGGIALLLRSAWRIRAEIGQLRERERRRLLALTAGGDELWQYDVGADRITRENPIPDLEHADARTPSDLAGFLQILHADDRERIRCALSPLVSGRATHAEASYRAHRRDGGWSWVHTCARVVASNRDGKATVIVGTTREISAVKHDAERLSLALQAAGEELWELDIGTDRLFQENPTEHGVDLGGPDRAARDEFFKVCHPDDLAQVRQAYLAVRWAKAEILHVVYRMRSKNGSYRWMESHGRGIDPDDDGLPTRMIGTNRDITALKEGEERLRLVLWGSGAELWDIDMNTGAIRRSNMIPDLCINDRGQTILFSDLVAAVSPEDAPGMSHAFVAHAKAQTPAYEAWFRLLNADGEWRWMYSHGRITERADSGWAVRMAGIMHDITSVKQTEDELRRLNEELEDRVARRTADLSRANTELSGTIERLGEAQAQLVESEKMAALGSLVAGVAHEINTPLGVSIAAASHMGEEIQLIEARLHEGDPADAQLRKSSDVIRQCVELVLRNLDRAAKLVKSFKQVAVDQSSEQYRQIVLKDYLDEILLSLNPRIKRTGHHIALDCSSAIRLVTYPGAIYQAITNLVINSLVHGFDGIEAGAITIRAREDGEFVLLEYRDNGRGMAADVLRRVFDPFFTTRRGQGGTGLGMHITYNLVTQLLGGSIRCESAPDSGVLFEVRIPRSVRAAIAGGGH